MERPMGVVVGADRFLQLLGMLLIRPRADDSLRKTFPVIRRAECNPVALPRLEGVELDGAVRLERRGAGSLVPSPSLGDVDVAGPHSRAAKDSQANFKVKVAIARPPIDLLDFHDLDLGDARRPRAQPFQLIAKRRLVSLGLRTR
jgi:hypothetical protein